MIATSRFVIVGAGLLALVGWVLTSSGRAADDKDVKPALRKLAAAIEKDDAGEIKKQAAETAKMADEIDEFMHAFALRTKKGLGVGDKAGAITPDGIEAKLQNLGKKAISKGDLGKQNKALLQMSHDIGAIAQIALIKTPAKDQAQWTGWAKDMSAGAKDLAAAIKSGDPAAVKATATKLDGACTACHEKFR